MNTAEISSDIVEVLSRITGQKLNQRDVTPTLLFAVNLMTILFGVMLADGEVSPEEKQQFQKTLNQFIPPQGNMRQLVQLLGKGVKQNKVYAKFKVIQALSESLSEPEKLLLLGLGYEMSAADGSIDATEKRYLDAIASKVFQLNPRYGTVFETALTQPEQVDAIALMELEFLLNPGRFQNLDLAFIEAASQLLERLQAAEKPQETVTPQTPQASEPVAYESLRQFQAQKRNLDEICMKLYQVLQDCVDQSFIPATLIQDLGKISQKLQSQSFRVAVVGEFSKGKSTLLNALLGEEIQPTRAIPCSGTVTVLRHGTQKRVICRYDDGREEIISSELYKEKVSISHEEALAQESLKKNLAESNLTEVIFEHPSLALCKNGVEIVDSPGLNEHPARTAITEKLVTGTDAVIFLTDATNVLTQTEQELLRDLQRKLNSSSSPNEPATNLFVVVNRLDLLRLQNDREDVKKRVDNIILGESSLVAGDNRIHFISAQSALDAKQQGIKNEYSESLDHFIASIECFLREERGSLMIKKIVDQIRETLQRITAGLLRSEKLALGNLELSEQQQQDIIDKIGEVAGRDIKIRILFDVTYSVLDEEITDSWNEWVEGLAERLANKSINWNTNHSSLWQQDRVIQDYTDQFLYDLESEIESWKQENLKPLIEKSLEYLDRELNQELKDIKNEIHQFDIELGTNFEDSFDDVSFESLDSNWFVDGLKFLFSVLSFSIFGIGLIGVFVEEHLKTKVFQAQYQQFVESVDSIFEQISQVIETRFDKRLDCLEEVVNTVIISYNSLLDQHSKQYQQSQQQRSLDQLTISLKRQEIEKIQEELDSIT